MASIAAAATDFELANVGPGPDPMSLRNLVANRDFVVLFFQRDYYCTNCRQQVQDLRDRYAEFEERGAEVASVVPEEVDRLQDWQESYDLPFPLLADPEAIVSDAYDQPVRFGLLGKFSDFLGRMPQVVVLDCRGDEPTVGWSYAGKSTSDRPSVDDVLAELDRLREEVSE